MTLLLMSLAGGVGAMLRFLTDGLIRARVRTLPTAPTAVVNATGTFALAVITGLVTSHVIPPAALAVVGTGLLGGYTTFSTSAFETVRLLQRGRRRRAVAAALAQLTISLVAAVAGYALGVWL